MGAFLVPIQPVKSPSVIAFQKSRSSCNWDTFAIGRPFVIAFQKSRSSCNARWQRQCDGVVIAFQKSRSSRSEEHTSELQYIMRISYAVFGLHNKTQVTTECN